MSKHEKTCLNMSSGKKIAMNSMAEVNVFLGFELISFIFERNSVLSMSDDDRCSVIYCHINQCCVLLKLTILSGSDF